MARSVAMMAKHSLSFSQLTHIERNECVLALMGVHAKEPAGQKVISILFFSINQAAWKTLLDNISAAQIATIILHVPLRHVWTNLCCDTLDGFCILSREQETKERFQ